MSANESRTEDKPEAGGGKTAPKRRAPKKITRQYLHNYSLYYLERFASSSANLRQVLLRRARKSCRHHGTDFDEAVDLIDAEIARLQEVGLLDDAAYAEARARGLSERGGSTRAIRAKLMAKGVGEEEIEGALGALEEEHPEPDFAAAVTHARKKRLGPYRAAGKRAEMREKDLAALARAGFGYDMALKVIDAESAEALEDEELDMRQEARDR